MPDAVDRVRGSIYGAAVGDALGATVEFMPQAEIRRRYGVLKDIVGGGWLNLQPGEWTDDTEMMLAVAEGIIADPEDPVPHIGDAFLRWEQSNPPDIGGTTRAAFFKFRTLKKDISAKERWFKAAQDIHARAGHTAGNGALMRTLPVGIAYRDPETIYRQAVDIARMTHWDIRAGLTCAIYSIAVQNILTGEENEYVALSSAGRTIRRIDTEHEEELKEILGAPIMRDGSNLRPTGYTVDSFHCAVWAFITSKDFEDAVVRAVNLGGDADTIGAIAGGLAGAYWGYEAIPDRWLEKFTPEQRAKLDRAAEGLLKVAGEAGEGRWRAR